MKHVRTTLTTAAVAALVALGAITVAPGAGAAGAAGAADAAAATFADPFVGMQVLDRMCGEDGGSPVNTPFTISRCESARSRGGFETERLVCEGLLGGTFSTVPNVSRPQRTNWFCFPGANIG
jgi:hypothetical protein